MLNISLLQEYLDPSQLDTITGLYSCFLRNPKNSILIRFSSEGWCNCRIVKPGGVWQRTLKKIIFTLIFVLFQSGLNLGQNQPTSNCTIFSLCTCIQFTRQIVNIWAVIKKCALAATVILSYACCKFWIYWVVVNKKNL